MVSFSVSQLFEMTFGRRSSAFDPKFDQQDPERTVTSPYANYEGDKGGKYWGINANTGLEYYMPVKLGGIQLHHPVISTNLRILTIETPMTEVNGAVVEEIQLQGFTWTIEGIIISKDKEFPENEVEELKDLINRRELLDIVCPITNILWVQPDGSLPQALITEFDFPPTRGIKGVRGYRLRGMSKVNFSLEEI